MHTVARSGIGGIPLPQLARVLHFGRVDMLDRQASDLARLIDDVNSAPIGDLRHRQPGERGQRLFVVERLREHGPNVSEESGLAPRGFRGIAVDAFLFVQRSRRHRSRREVGERLPRLQIHLAEVPRRPIVENQGAGTLESDAHRHHQHRPDALFAIRVELVFEQRLGADVGHRHRIAERHSLRRHSILARLDHAIRERLGHAFRLHNPPLRPVCVVGPDGIAIGHEQLARD